jgi:hypothetical protein
VSRRGTCRRCRIARGGQAAIPRPGGFVVFIEEFLIFWRRCTVWPTQTPVSFSLIVLPSPLGGNLKAAGWLGWSGRALYTPRSFPSSNLQPRRRRGFSLVRRAGTSYFTARPPRPSSSQQQRQHDQEHPQPDTAENAHRKIPIRHQSDRSACNGTTEAPAQSGLAPRPAALCNTGRDLA